MFLSPDPALNYALAGQSLPECPTNQSETWNNCFGTYWNTLGDVYVGEFADNKFDGSGTLTLHSGDAYSGQFKADRMSGVFSVQYANGDRFEGQYEGDKRNGSGNYSWADGRVYTGSWVNGLPEGEGRYMSADKIELPRANFRSNAEYFDDGALISADVLVDQQ